MRLYLTAKVKELNLSYLQFLETAHFWKFGRAVIPQEDYTQFCLHGVIPKYCVEFLHDIQEKERKRCTNATAQSVVNQSSHVVSSDIPQP